MRVTIKVADEEYWFDLKDVFTRKDLRRWRDALGEDERAQTEALAALRQDDPRASDADLTDAMLGESNALSLLGRWCSGCYLRDEDGNEYHQIGELNREALDNMDAAIVTRFYSLPTIAFNLRAGLGEVKSGRSSNRS